MNDDQSPALTKTILFADICRSTYLFEQLGDERALAMETRTLARAGDIAQDNCGEVIGTIGDEVLCTFDSPRAAVYAARDIHASIRNQPAEPDHPVRMRIGVNHGKVLPSRNSVYGDTVNVAARLAQMAKAGQTLLSKSVADAAGSDLQGWIRPIGNMSLAGKSSPVEVLELLPSGDEERITEVGEREQAPPRAYSLKLEYLNRSITLNPTVGRFVFGRSIDCDQPIDHPTISREHAEIIYRDGQFILRDFSTNGSYIRIDGQLFTVHRGNYVLPASGVIYFGHTARDKRMGVSFRCLMR